MKNLFNLCGGAILAAALATPAAAQTAGTYNGTQANGQGYALTLSTDPNNGMLAITAGSVGVDTTLCKPAGEGNVGWGFGTLTDVTGPRMSFTFGFPDFYTVQSLHFHGSTVTGTITSYEAVFSPSTGRPRKASFCTVPKQTFTATLGAAPAGAKPAKVFGY
jgi:hypothetical protein